MRTMDEKGICPFTLLKQSEIDACSEQYRTKPKDKKSNQKFAEPFKGGNEKD